MATDTRAPHLDPGRRPPSRLSAVDGASSTSLALVGSLLLGPAVLLAALSRNFGIGLALLVLAMLVVAAFLSGFRSFVHVFLFASVLRPLVDLSAGPRDSGIALTELFGVGILAVMGGWLLLNWRVLLPRLTKPLPAALLSLVLVNGLATVGSVGLGPSDGLAATLRLTTGVAAFLVTDLLLATGRLSFRQVLQLILAVSAVPLLYPLLGFAGVTVTTQKDGIEALKSVFFLSNNFAYFLVPLAIVGAASALRTRGGVRLAAIAYLAVVLVELILTETRGAWLCAALGVLIVCVLLDRRIAALAVVVLIGVVLLVPSVNSRIADLVPDPDAPRTESSLAWRFGQWEGLIPSVQASPVLGGGPGEAYRSTGKEAHNDYLKALIDTGLIGLGVYLWFIAAMLATAWRAYARVGSSRRRADKDPLLVAVVAAAAAYAVAIAVASSGDNLIDNVTFLWSTLPLMAVARWALTAPASHLRTSRHDQAVRT